MKTPTAKVCSLLATVALLSACNTTSPNSPESSSAQVLPLTQEVLNASTSRAKRTEYLCRVATEVDSKPFPRGLDNFRMSHHGTFVVDLYGDGSIETISGFSDETWKASDDDYRYEGNEERSRKGAEYMLFSSNPDTRVPDGLKFLGASFFPADFNSDGVDDLAITVAGPDYSPFIDQHNFVMLSSPNGYKKVKLPGSKSTYHSGTNGDIDNDGDVDFIATPGTNNRVVAYINQGDGSFKYKEIIGRSGNWNTNERFYNAKLWDIDGDGFLDLFMDGHKELAAIYWGRGGMFESKATRINTATYQIMFDAEFIDIDNDGENEIVMLSSLAKHNSADDNYYRGWGLYVLEMNERSFVAQQTVYEKIYDGGYARWFPQMTGCDLKNDGDIDIVINVPGQLGYVYEASKTGMIVFENEDGSLKYEEFQSPKFYESLMGEGSVAEFVSEEIERGHKSGVELNGYIPSKVYFPTPTNERYQIGDIWPFSLD